MSNTKSKEQIVRDYERGLRLQSLGQISKEEFNKLRFDFLCAMNEVHEPTEDKEPKPVSQPKPRRRRKPRKAKPIVDDSKGDKTDDKQS